ncbi:hypothetical protein ACWGJW_35355 [Streptomyces nigrescens]
MGQLLGYSQIMLALSLVGVGVPVGASGELLVGQFTEATAVRPQRLAVDICIGVFLTEATPVFSDPLTFLLQRLRTDLPLAGSSDLIGAGQKPGQRRRAQEDPQPAVALPLAVRVSDSLRNPAVPVAGAGIRSEALELDAEGRILVVPACRIPGLNTASIRVSSPVQ